MFNVHALLHLYLIAFIPIVGPVVDGGIALPFALFAAIFWNLDTQQFTVPTYYIHTGYNIGFTVMLLRA